MDFQASSMVARLLMINKNNSSHSQLKMISTYKFALQELGEIGPYLLTMKPGVICTYCICLCWCKWAVYITFVRTMHRIFAGYCNISTPWQAFSAVLKDRVTPSVINVTCGIAKRFSSGRNNTTLVARWTLKCIAGF